MPCADFAGKEFTLIGTTFMPRRSSLPLIDFATRVLTPAPAPLLLDLCCGSGALGITLASALPIKKVLGLDSSIDALRSCTLNMRRHGVNGASVEWTAGAPLPVRNGIVAICNPPFLRDDEVAIDDPERASLMAGQEGAAIASLCLTSAAGAAQMLILKCSEQQLEPLRRMHADFFRLVDVEIHEIRGARIACSAWRVS